MRNDQQHLVSRILVDFTLGCAISGRGVYFAKSSCPVNTICENCDASISSNLGIEFLQYVFVNLGRCLMRYGRTSLRVSSFSQRSTPMIASKVFSKRILRGGDVGNWYALVGRELQWLNQTQEIPFLFPESPLIVPLHTDQWRQKRGGAGT